MTKAKTTQRDEREHVKKLTDIINVGTSIAGDFESIGISKPQDLIGKDPFELYQQLIQQEQTFHDPCVLDTFMSAVDFMNGNPPKKWWTFTDQRKEEFTPQVDSLRKQFSL